jgi:hypothetical protein
LLIVGVQKSLFGLPLHLLLEFLFVNSLLFLLDLLLLSMVHLG